MFKLKIILILLILFSISLALHCENQNKSIFHFNHKIDSTNTKILYLNIQNINFFKNNEYFGENSFGYTLPGFNFRPSFSYQPTNKIKLELGIDMIRFYGAEKYPFLTYSGLTQWKAEIYHYGFHITPFYRAQVNLFESLNIVFGNLYRNNNHGLITPMYNRELNYSSESEEGLQVLYNSRYIDIDTWLNWENFIFKNNGVSEMFTLGTSTNLKLIDNKTSQLYFPFSFVGKHIGGEGDTSSNVTKENWVNNSVGIGYKHKLNDYYFNNIGAEINLLNSNNLLEYDFPINNGRAIYSNIYANSKNLKFELGYWLSRDYIPLLGNSLFGNISSKNEGFVFGDINMIFFDMEYKLWVDKNYCFGIDFQAYHTFPHTRKSNSLPLQYNNSATSYSFGLFLRLNPKIRIVKLDKD